MRPLKYQAWHKRDRKMYHVATIMPDARMVMLQSGDTLFSASFEEIELRQFTGLLDKAGKEMYEGDILRIGQTLSGEFRPFYPPVYVKWRNDRWVFVSAQGGCWSFQDSYFEGGLIEVIGNIYDNQELLNH